MLTKRIIKRNDNICLNLTFGDFIGFFKVGAKADLKSQQRYDYENKHRRS